MSEELKASIAVFLGDLVDCYSRDGQFNQVTAPLGTVEIREEAMRLLKLLEKSK